MYNDFISLLILINQADSKHSHTLFKYKFKKRKNICSNSKFDIFFDHIVSNNKEEIEDFLVVKPKVTFEEKIAGICVLPYFNGDFFLMHCWRHQFDEFIYQAPTGFVEKNEKPFETALRELKEETSLICNPKNLIPLGSFLPDAGLVEGRVALFLAKECEKSNYQIDKEIGSSQLISFTKEEIKKFLETGKNIGGSTLITCMRSLKYLKEQI